MNIIKYTIKTLLVFLFLLAPISVYAACTYCSEREDCSGTIKCENFDHDAPYTFDCTPLQDDCTDTWGQWSSVGYAAATASEISSLQAHSGSYSIRQRKAAGVGGTYEISIPLGSNVTEFYLRFYIYFGDGWASRGDGEVNHMIFLETASSANLAIDVIGRPGGALYFATHRYNPGEAYQLVSYDITQHLGEWICVEWHYDFSDYTSQYWINGVLTEDGTFTQGSYSQVDNFIISGFCVHSKSYYQDFYIDDFVIADSYIGLSVPAGGVTGTIVPGGCTESEVVAGGKYIDITVTGTTWVAAGATFNAQRQNILNGITAATSPANGWNDEWRDKEAVTAVVRTDDNNVRVTMSSQAAISGTFDIPSNISITCTIPGTATEAGNPITATPNFVISAEQIGVESVSGVYDATGPGWTFDATGPSVVAP